MHFITWIAEVLDVWVSRIRVCKLHDSLCLSGAGFLGLLGQQLSGAASGSGYTGKHFFPGSGTVQLIQLSLYSVTLFGLGFQVVVIGVFCTLTVQAFGDDRVHLVLREGAPGLLFYGSSGGGRFLLYSFIHGSSFPAVSVAVA